MIRLLAAYFGAAVVFIALDAVWLTLMGATLYRPALAPLLADQPRLVPAALFYVVYLAGLALFAVRPALRTRRWWSAPVHGATFGLVAYATYDLTNQATLKLWPTQVTVLDLGWGAFVSAAGATAGYFASRRVKR